MFTGIIEEIGHAKVIGITGHIRPDGDVVGSTLGYIIISGRIFLSARLLFILKSRQMNFNYLSGVNDIKHEAEDKHFDLFVVLDCSSMDRLNHL